MYPGSTCCWRPPRADLSKPISLPQVQQVLSLLKRMYPWVLVDLGLPLDETAFAFLDGADRIVMSVLPEMIGLRNTRLMLDQLHERGYPEEKIWLVLNRSGLRGGVSVSDIQTRLHVHVKHTIPDDQPLVTLTVNRGVPAVLSHGRSALARAYHKLAEELAKEMPEDALTAGEADVQASRPGGRRSCSADPARPMRSTIAALRHSETHAERADAPGSDRHCEERSARCKHPE